MPKKTPEWPWRYGCALLLVALATAIRLAVEPVLRDRFPLITFFAAVVFTAWYAGFGPSLVALVLSWFAADYFVLRQREPLPIFENRGQIGFAYFMVGLTVTLLAEFIRAAQRRARASGAETQRALEGRIADQEWLRITLASIGDAVITTDSEGLVISLNPVAERLTGWSSADAAGLPLRKVFRTVDETTNRSAELPLSLAVQETAMVLTDDHMLYIDKNGGVRSIEQNAAPIRDDQGKIMGAVIVIRDITERRRADEALREADRRKEEFLAVLSHELRNPLAPIQSALDLMSQTEMSRTERERELAVVVRQVRHLTRLVDDLLDVSRINRGRIELQKEVVVLGAAVSEVIEAIKPLIDQRKMTLRVALPDETIRLDADTTRLEQIFLNLLTNAVKYTNTGGRIELTAARDGGDVVVRVQDNGIGISGAMLPRIFDLFVRGELRADAKQGGLGIGLSLVKTLVEKHGGTISAQSQGPGTGSVFVVRLPVLPAALADGRRSPEPDSPEGLGVGPRRRILIVDDNTIAADGLGKLLSFVYGQDVRVIYDGRTALEVAGSFQPDIVLLDLGMSVMDGYEVARRLRELPECAAARLVAVTGWGQEEDRRRSREMGFDMHLVKPVNTSTLKRLIADSDPEVGDDAILVNGATTHGF
jgi:PAS domain S-box-containing protein